EPSAGHETEDQAVDGTAANPERVLVVGAGPAGLEAARVAALRGHRVRVVDRAAASGGAVPASAAGSGRERLARLAGWLRAECDRLGVRFDLGTDAGEADIVGHAGPVLLCTGSRDGRRDYPVEDGADVRTARAVLAAVLAAQPGDEPTAVPAGGPAAVLVAQPGDEPTAVPGAGADPLPPGPVLVWDPVGGPVGISVAEL